MQDYSITYFWVFFGLQLAIILSFYGQVVMFFKFAISASRNLYQRAMDGVLNTTLRFFDVTPQGRIINRLVKDAESIDFVFGRFLVISMSQATGIIGSIIISCITSWPCVFIMIITLIIFGFLFSRFRAITPQLKRLESNTRSKVFSICQETLD